MSEQLGRNTEHWHLSKSVNIGQIFSIVLLAVALMTAWSDVQKSVDGNRKDIEHIREIQRIQNERTQEMKSDLSERLDRLDESLQRFERKLDKVIQRAN